MSPRGEPRARKVTFTLTEREYTELNEVAHEEGLPVATFLRRIIRAEVKKLEMKRRTERDTPFKRALESVPNRKHK